MEATHETRWDAVDRAIREGKAIRYKVLSAGDRYEQVGYPTGRSGGEVYFDQHRSDSLVGNLTLWTDTEVLES